MNPNAKITNAVYAALRGDFPTEDSEPGFCLKWVRQVIERAFDWPSHHLYEHYVTDWVQPDSYPRDHGHWARDAERSLRARRMAVQTADAKAGDLVFNWRAAWSDKWGAYIGHVAIVVEDGFIAENIDPRYRPHSLTRGALALTPRTHWAEPTTVIRFDPDRA